MLICRNHRGYRSMPVGASASHIDSRQAAWKTLVAPLALPVTSLHHSPQSNPSTPFPSTSPKHSLTPLTPPSPPPSPHHLHLPPSIHLLTIIPSTTPPLDPASPSCPPSTYLYALGFRPSGCGSVDCRCDWSADSVRWAEGVRALRVAREPVAEVRRRVF